MRRKTTFFEYYNDMIYVRLAPRRGSTTVVQCMKHFHLVVEPTSVTFACLDFAMLAFSHSRSTHHTSDHARLLFTSCRPVLSPDKYIRTLRKNELTVVPAGVFDGLVALKSL